MSKCTHISIKEDRFFINDKPTYKGVSWQGHKIEGLLINTRMVQGIFDDLNPETQHLWVYPDTGKWSAERNTDEFIAAMPSWLEHGVLAFTLNLQGGSPFGYSQNQPWINSAFQPDGSLHPDYMARLKRILDKADELGMVVILGLFYFGQDEYLEDETAVIRAVENAVAWLKSEGYCNILLEINNECDVSAYDHKILMPQRVHELIKLAKSLDDGLLVSTSFRGRSIPTDSTIAAADFLLIHGNGVSEPEFISKMVHACKQMPSYRPMPILINEDDHFDFNQPMNNMVAAIQSYASWGFFDYRMENEGFNEGYQSVPVNWTISSQRKRGFFDLAKEMTRGDG